jgi:hypothetical protein
MLELMGRWSVSRGTAVHMDQRGALLRFRLSLRRVRVEPGRRQVEIGSMVGCGPVGRVGPVGHSVGAHAAGELPKLNPVLRDLGRRLSIAAVWQQMAARRVGRVESGGIGFPCVSDLRLRDLSAAAGVWEGQHPVRSHAAGVTERRGGRRSSSSRGTARSGCRRDGTELRDVTPRRAAASRREQREAEKTACQQHVARSGRHRPPDTSNRV